MMACDNNLHHGSACKGKAWRWAEDTVLIVGKRIFDRPHRGTIYCQCINYRLDVKPWGPIRQLLNCPFASELNRGLER